MTLDRAASQNFLLILAVHFSHRCGEEAVCTMAEYFVIYFYVLIVLPLEGRGKFLKVCREKKGKLKEINDCTGGELGDSWFLSCSLVPFSPKEESHSSLASVRLNSVSGETSILDHL